VALLAEYFLEELNKAAKDTPPEGLHQGRRSIACAPTAGRGNVRELRNVVQRAYILAPNDIGVDALPLGVVEERLGTSLSIRVGTPDRRRPSGRLILGDARALCRRQEERQPSC
jgi:DNA-binding NtrC family response regulator